MTALETKPNDMRPPILRAQKARKWLAEFDANTQNSPILFIFGIKDLKQINERLGRERGDLLIGQVGGKIVDYVCDSLPQAELIARMPGREFLLILNSDPDTNTEILEMHTTRFLDRLATDFGEKDNPLFISARIGIAMGAPGESGTDILHRAATALSSAYERKGRKFAFAKNSGGGGNSVNVSIDAGVRAAILERQITIVLQPQFEVSTGRLIGAEALARLQHAELGEIGANQLFAAADRCDLREELSHLIQEEAIAIAAKWPAALNNLRLSVNLGAEELGEGYSERLLEMLANAGFPADRLTLELTEESLVRDMELAMEQLGQLRKHGIRIAVDDFGTGYSSLSYLKALPLDYVKIDKGMTPDIGGTGKDRIILRAIIAMAKALGLKIIAEGVEKEGQLAMLKAEECDYFQGFLRSRPLSSQEFEHFALRSN